MANLEKENQVKHLVERFADFLGFHAIERTPYGFMSCISLVDKEWGNIIQIDGLCANFLTWKLALEKMLSCKRFYFCIEADGIANPFHRFSEDQLQLQLDLICPEEA